MIDNRSFSFSMPDWITGFFGNLPEKFSGIDDAMRCAVKLSSENVRCGTGGPFGAVVFSAADMRPLGVGVNLVVPEACSVLHAEIVALCFAERMFGSHSFRGTAALCSSSEPCAMCMGAIPWSGVCALYCGARDSDVREAGFDEGDKPPAWTDLYARRGIEVHRDVMREEAVSVLREYRRCGGKIY